MMVVKYGRKRKIPNHLFEKKKLRKLSLFHILYSSQQFAALDFIVRERNANTNIAMEISKKTIHSLIRMKMQKKKRFNKWVVEDEHCRWTHSNEWRCTGKKTHCWIIAMCVFRHFCFGWKQRRASQYRFCVLNYSYVFPILFFQFDDWNKNHSGFFLNEMT